MGFEINERGIMEETVCYSSIKVEGRTFQVGAEGVTSIKRIAPSLVFTVIYEDGRTEEHLSSEIVHLELADKLIINQNIDKVEAGATFISVQIGKL